MSARSTPPAERPEWYTVPEVAARMRVAKMTIYRAIHSGELAAIRLGRTYRINAATFEAYLSGGGSK